MAAKKKTTEAQSRSGGRQRLRPDDVASRLEGLVGWRTASGGQAIARTYELPGFRAALAFVAFAGELAEAKNHHPDIDIRYNKVTLTLSTHDAGGVTARDFELARLIDSA
jgi:4a-hydroxytetrahydrobiopterin dehydratase